MSCYRRDAYKWRATQITANTGKQGQWLPRHAGWDELATDKGVARAAFEETCDIGVDVDKERLDDFWSSAENKTGVRPSSREGVGKVSDVVCATSLIKTAVQVAQTQFALVGSQCSELGGQRQHLHIGCASLGDDCRQM